MDAYRIGRVIRDLRLARRLTQQQLAEGICTQTEISRIENHKVIPYGNVLFQIANRLGTTVELLFSYANFDNYEYVNEVMQSIREAAKLNRYDEVYSLVKLEFNGFLFQDIDIRQFLLWHKGMAEFYFKNNVHQSMKDLREALALHDSQPCITEIQINIKNTMANIFTDIGNFEEAIKLYKSCTEEIKTLPYISDGQLNIRLHYNLARALSKAGCHSEVIPICRNGISLCTKGSTLYLLGELNYQMAYSYGQVQLIDKSVKYFEKSIKVFEITGQDSYVEKAREMIDKFTKNQ